MKHRVVSVGDRRSLNRLMDLIRQACDDEGLPVEQCHQIPLRVFELAKGEGFVITRQTSPAR